MSRRLASVTTAAIPVRLNRRACSGSGTPPVSLGITGKRERRRVVAHIFLAALATCAVLLAGATWAQAAFPGTNGKIAFSTDQASAGPQIFTVNPNGSGETQLTFARDGHASAPEWSPDGSKIIFDGDVTGSQQIYEMAADGSGRSLLLNDPGFNDTNPRFSPDGSMIAFSRCSATCVIDVVNANGTGPLTQLTSTVWNSFDPEWSPDGQKIAFDSNQDGLLSAVWVMNADGSGQQRLTAPALEAAYPDWSPDGSHILFGDLCCQFGTNIWVMNADGSGQKQLTHLRTKHQAGFASYSPDGKKISLIADLAYKNGCCNDLYTMDANGTHLTKIVGDQPGVFFSDWGPAP
jgi:Tol biopolymer transport system component